MNRFSRFLLILLVLVGWSMIPGPASCRNQAKPHPAPSKTAPAQADQEPDAEPELSIQQVPFLEYTYVPEVAHYGKQMGMDMPVARAYKIYRGKSVVHKGEARHPDQSSANYGSDDYYTLVTPEGTLEKGRRPKDTLLILTDMTSYVRKPARKDPLLRLARAQPPMLVISYYPGGAHSQSEYSFFSVTREKFLPTGKVKSFALNFVDVDGDGIYEMLGYDRTFNYWHGAAYVESYSPAVFLQLQNGKLALEEKKQKESPLPAGFMDRLAAEARKSMSSARASEIPKGHFELSAPIWANMLKLTYTGNGGRIREYLDMFWPKGMNALLDDGSRLSKEAFQADFMRQLKKSPYWENLRRLNGWSS